VKQRAGGDCGQERTDTRSDSDKGRSSRKQREDDLPEEICLEGSKGVRAWSENCKLILHIQNPGHVTVLTQYIRA
jgi:hypothetical protein